MDRPATWSAEAEALGLSPGSATAGSTWASVSRLPRGLAAQVCPRSADAPGRDPSAPPAPRPSGRMLLGARLRALCFPRSLQGTSCLSEAAGLPRAGATRFLRSRTRGEAGAPGATPRGRPEPSFPPTCRDVSPAAPGPSRWQPPLPREIPCSEASWRQGVAVGCPPDGPAGGTGRGASGDCGISVFPVRNPRRLRRAVTSGAALGEGAGESEARLVRGHRSPPVGRPPGGCAVSHACPLPPPAPPSKPAPWLPTALS